MTTDKDNVKSILSLYKIDTAKIRPSDSNITEGQLIDEVFTHLISQGYVRETGIKKTSYDGFKVNIFFLQKTSPYKKWEMFLEDVVNENNQMFHTENGKFNQSFLSFVCLFQKDKEMFALCTGKGYLAIGKYMQDDFGFDLLTRLIRQDSSMLKSATANHLAGSTFEDINFFRSSESFLSQDGFGKIFREAISQLDKEALNKIGVDTKNLEKANCLAKSSFTLKSGVSLKALTSKILPSIIKLLDSNPNFSINKVKQISKNHPDYKNLELELKEEIRTNFLSFDLFSPDETSAFFNANTYSVKRNSRSHPFEKNHDDLTNLINIQRIIKENDLLDFSNSLSFATEIDSITIHAFDESGKDMLKRGFSLIRGLHGEFNFRGKKYFWMNGKFWKIDDVFLNVFNDKVFEYISDKRYEPEDGIPLLNFRDSMGEGIYNANHAQVENFLCLDKKTPNGIELCDLLYSTRDKTYLIHVKKGFDRNIRDLASQVLTASRFLSEDQDFDYVKKVYGHGQGICPIPKSEKKFINLFKKKIVFVVAFASSKDVFSKDDFKALGSNIAKLEMFELLREFKKINHKYDLKIIRIPYVD